MEFIEKIKLKAKNSLKTIILPESEDIRILQGAEIVLKEQFANIILLGDEQNIKKLANDNKINVEGATIINPLNSDKLDYYANEFYELRKDKGMTIEKAIETLRDSKAYFATMMVKMGDADGMVSGACHPTADTLKPALQIIKSAPGVETVSAFFVMVSKDKEFGKDGIMIFADCGMNSNPTAEQLSDIAISSCESFNELVGDDEPKVAMLSYSTKGSAHSDMIDKVVKATKLANEKRPDLLVDGEMQLDAAIIPEIAALKAPGSKVAGRANILIFPDLDAGNIGYKLVQRFSKAEAYGPLCQGLDKPVNDLSRGCSAEDIAGVVAITAMQAISKEMK